MRYVMHGLRQSSESRATHAKVFIYRNLATVQARPRIPNFGLRFQIGTNPKLKREAQPDRFYG